MNDVMPYEWVIGIYKGEQAKYINGLIANGMGYFRMDGLHEGKNNELAVAFRRPCDSPLPDHLVTIKDQRKIDNLEKQLQVRSGVKV